jgi:hypothetical protein
MSDVMPRPSPVKVNTRRALAGRGLFAQLTIALSMDVRQGFFCNAVFPPEANLTRTLR